MFRIEKPETKAVTQVPSTPLFLKKKTFYASPQHYFHYSIQIHHLSARSRTSHNLLLLPSLPAFHRRSRRAGRGVAERALGLALAVREVASRRRPLQRAAKAGLAHHAPQPFVDAHHQLDLALVVVGRRGRVGRPAPRTRAWGGEMAVSWEALRLTSIVEQRGAA